MEGIIIKNISNDYVVKAEGKVYSCRARGRFRKQGIVPLVGDKVLIDPDNLYLLEIRKRRNCLIRPSVANIDQALIVTSVKKPEMDTNLLDKLLTIISFHEVDPVVCFTKLDLLTLEEREKIDKYIDYYRRIGYMVVTNESCSNFSSLFRDKITVLTGQSGAGKSSLLNMLDSSLHLKTDEISEALNRGKHTTRHTELYEIMGGYIVDTPGFSQIDFHDMEKEDIRDNMKEMFDNLHYCGYRDCMHIKEDKCYVKKLVLRGDILETRYNNYKLFIESKK